eukprot:10921016-Ditylum_brightwellii.AAC.1
MSYDNSTISRDLCGVKGPHLTCISDTEQIVPRLMYTNQISTISRDWYNSTISIERKEDVL